jgi:hypothetical protein
MWMAALTVSTSANADVQPQRIGVANVAHDIAAKEQVARAVKLGARGFPRTLGVLKAHPLDEIVLDERVVSAHAANAFDTGVTDRIATHDMRVACQRISRAAPVLAADIETDAIGPFDGIALDDPVVAAAGRNQSALRRRNCVTGMLKGEAFDADVSEAALSRREGLFPCRYFD